MLRSQKWHFVKTSQKREVKEERFASLSTTAAETSSNLSLNRWHKTNKFFTDGMTQNKQTNKQTNKFKLDFSCFHGNSVDVKFSPGWIDQVLQCAGIRSESGGVDPRGQGGVRQRQQGEGRRCWQRIHSDPGWVSLSSLQIENAILPPQGPLDCTVDDFWLMVQQENSDTIVMLCNCIEMHKEKSAQYWPEKVGHTLLLGENREGVDLEVKGLISQQRWPNIWKHRIFEDIKVRVDDSILCLSQVQLDSEEDRGHYFCRTFTLNDKVPILILCTWNRPQVQILTLFTLYFTWNRSSANSNSFYLKPTRCQFSFSQVLCGFPRIDKTSWEASM